MVGQDVVLEVHNDLDDGRPAKPTRIGVTSAPGSDFVVYEAQRSAFRAAMGGFSGKTSVIASELDS